jgi:hypothetical protein
MVKLFALFLALYAGSARAADGDSGLLSGLVKFLKDFINKLWDKITKYTDWTIKVIEALVKALWDMFTDLIAWAFDQILDIIGIAIDSMYTESGADELIQRVSSTWDGLPLEVTMVMASIGLGTAMTMIAGALFIRILLQLIPFTRLGS